MCKQGKHLYFFITLMLEDKDLLKRFNVPCCPPVGLPHGQQNEAGIPAAAESIL